MLICSLLAGILTFVSAPVYAYVPAPAPALVPTGH